VGARPGVMLVPATGSWLPRVPVCVCAKRCVHLHCFVVSALPSLSSGNLRSAVRMGVASYNLLLEPDTNTLGHTQWFFFRVRGMVPGVRYTFTIVNLEKPSSLFNEGMRPLMYLSTAPGG
jgi:hypothetical protein